ncbi:hypothetical protein B9N43_01590 [Denitratisoma sp. DHT3]|uniref:DUF354 domain-containing protein n=1 Tax=Denitratisoma sp. DHT3 TaxID=1981880 RepID=UPI001198AA4F|nr:DUF354 domain-containing protein [Denitratisoma sp. DHT3]QDX80059.1 hypothetical protein B9N43_01590 [Denitratisoma sp. DHT3]
MKFLIDINHPAHVHFFRQPMELLAARGHELVVTSRAKEMALPLLDELGVRHVVLSAHKGGGLLVLGQELIKRDWALWQVARRERPDAMAAIGGTFVAHVGWLSGIPSLVFYDTENAKLQNAITYPFARRVIVPRCYQGRLPSHQERYDGYHELSYLHPRRFQPDRALAEHNGLDPARDNFFVRTVSWQANHDLLETGWSVPLLRRLVAWLAERGRVHISSETSLPEDLASFAYRGRVGDVHHLMAHCRLFVGESATMASECAVLGVPAIYAAHTGRGYTDEQEHRYGLVSNLRQFDADRLIASASAMLQQPSSVWPERHRRLLAETIDVASYVADRIEQRGTAL